MQCNHCGKETQNPKFCSRSCAASCNNRIFPKRKAKEKSCKHCGIEIQAGKTTCNSCNPSLVDWSRLTIRDLKEKSGLHYSSRIRDNARRVFKRSGLETKCKICGYSKHIEVCHLKPIKEFDEDTPISEVNQLSNLLALCSNHHWELDNNDLIV